MSPPREGRKEGSSKASDKTGEDIVDSGSKDLGSPLENPSSPQSTSINQETRLEVIKSKTQNVESEHGSHDKAPSKLSTSSTGFKRPPPPSVVVSTSSSSASSSTGKRSRASIIREPASTPRAPAFSSKLVRWLPLIVNTELDCNTIPTIPIPRIGHRAVMLKSKLIMFGGGNQQIMHELLVFDIPSKTWSMPQKKGDIPVGRASYGMDTLGNKIYIFGGIIEHGYYVNELYRLDVDSWTWTKLNPTGEIPCARHGHSFTRLNDSFYVFGGLTDDTPNPPRMELPRFLGDFFKLNVSSNLEDISWEIPNVFGSMPGPRESHSAVAHSSSSRRYNRLIIYGGMCGMRLNDLYIMDVDTRVWTKSTVRGIPPAPRSMHSANVVRNIMYVFGGWTPVSDQPEVGKRKCREVQNVWKVSSELHCLNLETLTWEEVMQRDDTNYWPKARAGHCSAAGQTSIFIWGGKDGFNLDENGRQVCLPEMLELVVEKPGVPGKVQLVGASCNSMVVGWKAVEGADSYVIQCCTYELPVLTPPPPVQMSQPAIKNPPPIPVVVPMPMSDQGKLVIPPTSTTIRIKQEPLDQDSQQVPQLKLASRQPIPLTLLRGPHPSLSVPNVMPIVLSGGANRMPSQGLQYHLPTGQIITLQSPISQGAQLSQPQRFQFLSRPIQFPQVQRQQQQQVPPLKLASRQPIPITLLRGPHPSLSVPNVMPIVLSGGANRMPSQGLQYHLPTGQIITLQSPISQGARLSQPQRFQFLSRPIQFPQVQRQQQQQQPALNFFRNPNQVNYHQLYCSNSVNRQGAQRIYCIPQSRPGLSGGPAFAPVPYPIQQQQQQAAITCTYFEEPSLQRPLQTGSPQMGVGFGRLPQVPVTGLAPRAAPPFTSTSSASPPPPPPLPPSRNFSFK